MLCIFFIFSAKL